MGAICKEDTSSEYEDMKSDTAGVTVCLNVGWTEDEEAEQANTCLTAPEIRKFTSLYLLLISACDETTEEFKCDSITLKTDSLNT